MAVRTAASSCSSSMGLVKKSMAPAFMARTLIGMSPWPVMKMIERSQPDAASACCSSRPLSPGMATSSTTQPGVAGSCSSRNSWGDGKLRASNPAARSRRASALRMAGSSSTTNTTAALGSS